MSDESQTPAPNGPSGDTPRAPQPPAPAPDPRPAPA
ncbi:MAG: hypothetical protein RL531_2066, partial [Actinomycetota bacterium]